MKSFVKNLVIGSLVMLGVYQGYSNTQLYVDPTQPWQGYVNAFTLPAPGSPPGSVGGYEFGSGWAMDALTAYYDNPSSPTTLTIIANTNTYDPSSSYWVQPDGQGNDIIDASWYVQNDNLAGQVLTFSGVCLTNTLGTNGTYTSTVFIKDLNQSYGVNASAIITATNGQPFSITLGTTSGDHIQYGFETIGPDANPTNVYNLGEAEYEIQYPPLELSALSSQAAVVGQNVSFTETPVGGAPYTYTWTFNGNPLSNGGGISITSTATNGTLTVSNAVGLDAGTYAVTVTNSDNVSASENAELQMIPYSQAETNLVIDASFESGMFATASTAGWFNYGNSSFNNTNDWYYDSPAVNPDVTVVDGTNCLEIASGGSGSYTGVFQDRPALPGQVYTASAWFLTPPTYTDDQIYGNTTCNLQVQFYDSGGNLLVDYESTPFSTNEPAGTWINMPVTNEYANNYVTLLGTSKYIVSPPNTASMRIQPGYVCPNGTSGGNMYVDMVDVTLHAPVVSAASSLSGMQLTFPTLFAPQYDVLYVTNLTQTTWQVLTSVTGDGTTKTVTDPFGSPSRFYIINTQN